MEKRNTFSLDTDYGKHEMRSRLEARTAYLFDRLGIKWEYEEHQILLSNGDIYIPDFYLPEQEVWIECKGDLEDPSIKKPKKLAEDKQEEVFIFSQEKNKGWTITEDGIMVSGGLNLNKCSCGTYSFVPNLGIWGCNNCGRGCGDDYIVKYNVFGAENWHSGVPDLQIKSTEDIDKFVEAVQQK